MSGRLVCLASLFLVLVVAGNVSAELVAHWKFDDGAGNTATDSVGNAHPGTIGGTANWAAGQLGDALDFDGASTYVDIGGDQPVISGTFSLTMWIYARGIPTAAKDYRMPLSNDTWADSAVHVHIMPETAVFRVDTKNGTDISSNTVIQADQWYHVASTLDAVGESKIYINGVLDNSATGNGREYIIGPANIGAYQESDRFFDGMIDDVRIYNHVLSEADIQELMISSPPGAASEPSPADEATDVPRDVALSWAPGEYAPVVNGHIVYLSDNFDNVNDGVGGVTQDASSYAPAQRFGFGKTYYWRVDEVNGAPDFAVHQGDVWSFTTEPIGHPIDGANITATASSGGLGQGPENTVNGSGLTDDLHSIETETMWLSGSGGPQPTWIQFEFDKIHVLNEMWVWNSNTDFETAIGYGFKDVTIEYSVDGTDYMTLGTTHQFARAPGTDGYAHNTTVDFGGLQGKYVRLTANSNWTGFVPQFGLSEVRFFHVPVRARKPQPDSGATDVDVDVTLDFRAGRQAVEHNVYLSTDEQAVIDGTAPVTVVTETSHSPLPLDLGSTYYWRVDEVNDAEIPTTWQGDIWNLSTPEFLVVEDFESFNEIADGEEGSNLVYLTWIDGFDNPAANGSTMGYTVPFEPTMETGTAHGGDQSAPLAYDNTTAAFSEVTLTLAPQDWTVNGVKTLSLWFYGNSANTPGQLYVKINGVKVTYDGDAGNLAIAGWQPWNIDLTALGVNLQAVTSLAIGIEGSGAVGTLLVDDIRLDAYERQLVTPSDPGNDNLVAYYALENNAQDSSGNGHDGAAVGAPIYVAGVKGMGLTFDGLGGQYVDLGTYNPSAGTGQLSVSLWVQWQGLSTQHQGLMGKRTTWSATTMMWHLEIHKTKGTLAFRQKGSTPDIGSPVLPVGEWAHLGVTYDGQTAQVFLNGQQTGSGAFTFGSDPGSALVLGAVQADGGSPFNGALDEIRLYDRCLSEAELLHLMSDL